MLDTEKQVNELLSRLTLEGDLIISKAQLDYITTQVNNSILNSGTVSIKEDIESVKYKVEYKQPISEAIVEYTVTYWKKSKFGNTPIDVDVITDKVHKLLKDQTFADFPTAIAAIINKVMDIINTDY